MTDHKFTDEEVIKALEVCVDGSDCKQCPINPNHGNYGYCTNLALTYALDLINRQKAEIHALTSAVDNSTQEFLKLHDTYQEQKAEIERLQDERDGRIKSLAAAFKIAEAEESCKAYILSQKAEAIKAFADKLTDRIMNQLDASHDAPDGDFYFITDVYTDIDNLVKEMTEEKINAK